MDTPELKIKLINQVNLLQDKGLLEELYAFLKLDSQVSKTYELSSQQKQAIEESREQVRNRDYLGNEEANLEIDKWLEK